MTVVVLRPSKDRTLRLVFDQAIPRLIEAHVPMRAQRYLPASLAELAREISPDLVHLHAAFVPHNTLLGRWALARDLPYAVHHRGAFASPLLERRSIRKRVYLATVERKVFAGAALAIGNTAGDLRDYRAVIPESQASLVVVPNPVVGDDDLDVLKQLDAEVGRRRPRRPFSLAYLGRWDVVHKGLDRLVAMMSSCPDLTLDVYTALRFKKERSLASQLFRRLPLNVRVHEPVDGLDKWRVLAAADGYVQLARWESFGVAVGEALAAGLPVFLAPEMHLVDELKPTGAAVTVDADNPRRAADQIIGTLSDETEIARVSTAGREFARERFHEDRVATQMLNAYRSVLR